MNRTEVNVKIKKLHQDAVIPKYAREFDSGFDLVAIEDVIIEPGQSVKVPTGLAMALPQGYELQVRPRSGISDKTKLRISNAPGTCDAGYRGEVCVLIDNITQLIPTSATDGRVWYDATFMLTGVDGEATDYVPEGTNESSFYNSTYVIRKGDRIAQGVLAAVPIAQFEVVDELDETERGADGFGSSGVRA
ncbi:dUTP diphosphatase [Brevibacillus porteri]|uniref:dUTP diphosphatase n=1 Tax=Brevibacillus porteri TaxID=2126350 RepID=UPI00363EE8B0